MDAQQLRPEKGDAAMRQLRVPAVLRLSAFLVLAVVLLAASAGSAGAKNTKPKHNTCTGSTDNFPTELGTLSGSYSGHVKISGACVVDAGATTIHGNLTVGKGSTLVALFASSPLTVTGNIKVKSGGTLMLGCFASSSPCLDDPDQENPTLNGPATVGGNIISTNALGVVVHGASIGGNVIQHRGGGGFTCEPQGVFALFGPPAYSTYEDSTIGGSIDLKGIRGCWLGVNRDQVHHSVRIFNNQLADPDAIEILSNHIHGNLNCRRNSMVWDSSDVGDALFPRQPQPNTVDGKRKGQCVLASPATEGGPLGPGPF
jgi:hypothetical protein